MSLIDWRAISCATKPPAKTGSIGKQPSKPMPKPAPGIVMPSYPNDVTFYQDLLWALMNTNEFMLNH